MSHLKPLAFKGLQVLLREPEGGHPAYFVLVLSEAGCINARATCHNAADLVLLR